MKLVLAGRAASALWSKLVQMFTKKSTSRERGRESKSKARECVPGRRQSWSEREREREAGSGREKKAEEDGGG